MDKDTVLEELKTIKSFKNITLNFNEEKNIFDIYARIKGDEDADYANTKDDLNNIDGLDYQYLDFGLFEFWFSPEDSARIVQQLKESF